MIKVELDDSQILDHIDYSRQQYIKWATGRATQEVFFTVMLSANQYLYDMPSGVVEVVNYSIDNTGNVNKLFTLENYLYSQGTFDIFLGSGNSLISYHIGMDFLQTLRKYTVDAYNYKYHQYTNQLEIQPPPPSGNSLSINGVTYDSPGWILVQSYMVEGSTISSDWSVDSFSLYLFDEPWILDYVTALSKISLGIIRNKFASFGSLGNQGIALDGDSMISEGKEEKERLEEKLRDEESEEGYGIYIF
jgi:hypothetical protein